MLNESSPAAGNYCLASSILLDPEIMFELQGCRLQVLLNAALATVCVVCYLLLVVLYLTPESYRVESLLQPNRGTIKPAAVVGLLATILAASTSTLVTRCVEHSLWIRLASGPSQKATTKRRIFSANWTDDRLTVGEVRRIAQWSTSALQRLLYLVEFDNGLDRRSWLLRPTGPLLMAAVIVVGPVLLTGISQSVATTITTQDVPRSVDPWQPRQDAGNTMWRSRMERDNPTTMAALVAMNNFTAPVAPLCNNITHPDRQSCSVKARTLSIRAECSGETSEDPDGVGLKDDYRNATSSFCVDQGAASELCVKLHTGTPNIHGAFASGRYPCTASDIKECPLWDEDGRWARLLGVGE
ncbi:hypothetical protein B0T21DRAFT_444443 [Apiosordaria backusii]|uniref:Uncharacterized protein n=1 Tax=Apiosordaria backusii TaxID=314023 RepID=A0AA40B7N9_9PEZI|nr:hypothetical protein B0T21DRAFT_444443 [Apiosordaria backusii]